MPPRRSICAAALLAAALTLAALLLGPVGAASAAGDPACTRYASAAGTAAGPGTYASPYATPQQLLDALAPGDTGCIRGGTYTVNGLRASTAGTAAKPITLMSYPGERATIRITTEVYVVKGADHHVFRNLTIADDPASTSLALVLIQDLADHTVWQGDDISAGSRVTCMIIGLQLAPWIATATGTVIDGNRIHDCGTRAHLGEDHGVYVANARGTQITNNVMWNASAYAVQLYPDADGVTIAHNVMDGSGWAGIVWASDDAPTGKRDDDDEAYANIITGGDKYALDVRWTTGEGTGNRSHDNCLWGNRLGDYYNNLTGVTRTGDVHADPGYLDAAHHDYRLPAGSPCLAVVGYDTAARLTDPPVPPPAGGGPGVPPGTTPPPSGSPPASGAGGARPVTVGLQVVRGRGRVVLRGRVSPPHTGWWVLARRLTPRGWATIARTRLVARDAGHSAFALSLPRTSRSQRLRVTVVRPGTRVASAVSRTVAVAAR